jgi:predicted Zn-dependent protease
MMPVNFATLGRMAVSLLCAVALSPSITRADTTSSQQHIWETQMGQQRYAAYAQRGEIVRTDSPLYQTLNPIAGAIAKVADAQYYAPFHFVLINEPMPNALSMPGGNVYVTTAMLSFLKNRDELAGVICHEVNHDIHHDMYNVYQATQGGRLAQTPNAIAYEKQVETNADRAGAYTCAKAGFNPWGMVWNLRMHGQTPNAAQQGGPNSDHPSDAQRAEDLVALFQSDPATFRRFKDDIAAAAPLNVPQMQVSQQYGYSRPQYPQYPPQQYPSYPAYPQAQPYPSYPQYPQAQPYPSYPQYPQAQPYPQQQPPYPPPPLPPCYPNC